MTPASARVRFAPFSPEFRRDPYPMYRDLRAARPVHRTLGTWVLTGHADVRAVLHDRTYSAGLIPSLVTQQARRHGETEVGRIERLGRTSLVFTDNPDHARLRALVNRVFTAASVARLRPLVERITADLLGEAATRDRFDVVADLAAPLPVAVLCEWMDLPASLRDRVGPWTHDIRFLLEPGLMTHADLLRVREVVDEFVAALGDVLERRRARPGEDLISRLLAARTGGGDALTDEELIFVCVMCFVAGNETTASLIGNATLALLTHPGAAAALRDRRCDARAVVAETLRYDPPLQMTKRIATRETEIGGHRIGAGDQVLLCLGAANRDPAVFERPDEFDPTRTPGDHLGFGHGMHGCLGGALAELQSAVALEALFRLPIARIDDEPDYQQHSFIIRGPRTLPVAVGHRPAHVEEGQ